MKFEFNDDKNKQLFKERGITFQNVIDSIYDRGVLLDFPHPNLDKYSNQQILVVEVDNYTYCIPYVLDKKKIFLKTIYPSRKFMYLLEKN